MICLGLHSENGLPVYVVRSPFGSYIQCGDATEADPKPLGCWLPPGLDPSAVTLETATEILRFPRTLGKHPVTGADVRVHLQQRGALIRSEIIVEGKKRHVVTPIGPDDDVLTMTLDRAIELLEQIGR